MLKNCVLPVTYLKTKSQTCGEIICENLQEFIINCKLCKIKIFEFEEFIQHFKNVHINGKSNDSSIKVSRKQIGQAKEDCLESVIKIEIAQVEEVTELSINNEENIELEWNTNDKDNDIDYEATSNEDEEQSYEEEPSKTILPKPRKPKELFCEICSKKYADQRRLQLHKTLVHLREKPYKCSQCDLSFAEERYLKNHTRSKHIGFECVVCHKVFKTNPIMKRHMLIHVDKKDFICNEKNCGKAFATKVTLRNHQRYHSGEMFVCEECGFKCRKRDSLIIHKRHHTGEKPFGCELCESRFGSKELLKEHMACHETERKHICDVCGKSFNRPKALYHHKHLHLGIKKFVCKICGQAYAQAAGLSAHMRKHRENVNSCSADGNSSSNLFYSV